MNLPCEVIRDLLPLYRDGACGETSRHFVAGHLQDCAACRQELAGLEAALAQTASSDESAPLKAVAKALEKKRRKVMWRSVLAAVLIVALSLGGYALAASISVPVKSSRLSVEEFAELSDGRLVLRFESRDRRRVSQVLWYQAEDNNIYVTPYVQLLDLTPFWRREQSLWDEYIAVNPQPAGGESAESLRLGSEKDHILIWTPGSEVAAADSDLEAVIASQDALLMPPDSYVAFSYPYYTGAHASELPPSPESAAETPPPDPLGLSEAAP